MAKYVQDEGLKKLLIERDKGEDGEHGGIGTPATRSEILKPCIREGLSNRKVKPKRLFLRNSDRIFIMPCLKVLNILI